MDKKCPFCGMHPKSEQVPGQVEYQCNTITVDDFPHLPQFGKDCLLRQLSCCSGELGEAIDTIATLRTQLAQTEAKLEKLEGNYKAVILGRKDFRLAYRGELIKNQELRLLLADAGEAIIKWTTGVNDDILDRIDNILGPHLAARRAGGPG